MVMAESVPAPAGGVNRELARKYDAVAYAAQAHPLSHPGHLATVATLLGLDAPDVATCRVLEVGCSDGANLLPMAATMGNPSITSSRTACTRGCPHQCATRCSLSRDAVSRETACCSSA